MDMSDPGWKVDTTGGPVFLYEGTIEALVVLRESPPITRWERFVWRVKHRKLRAPDLIKALITTD